MSNLSVIERYSNSLFEVALEKNEVAKVMDDLKEISKIFIDDKEVNQFFSSPVVKSSDKALLLKEVLNHGDFSEHTKNYFNLLITNDRFDFDVPHLSYISFNNFYLKSQGIKRGKIILAKELTDEEKEKTISEISKKLGFKVELEFSYSEDLIDGSYLEIEGVVYEDSLKKRLSELEKWLKG